MKNKHTPEPILPEATKRLISELEDYQEQTDYLCALAAEGWPVRVLTDATGLSRSAIHRRLRSENSTTGTPHPVPKFNHKLFGPGVKSKALTLNIPPADREKMHDLHQKAKNRTRWSEPTSEENIASQELDHMIRKYVQRKVSLTTIAKHIGVTRRAVAQRIEKFDV